MSTFFFINFLNHHTKLPLADGLFDSKSAGIGVSLWWCVISKRETITTKAKRKYFLVLQHILPHSAGPYPRVLRHFLQWSVRALPYHFLCPARAFLPCNEPREMQTARRYFAIGGTAGTGWPQVPQGQALDVTVLGLLVLTWCSEPGCPARNLQHLSVTAPSQKVIPGASFPNPLPRLHASWNTPAENRFNQPHRIWNPVLLPLPPQNEKANSELCDSASFSKPLKSLKQANDEITTYHSHLGEINKAFLSKVWCSLFNKCQICQVHPQIRNGWGVTAAKPTDSVLKLIHK